MREWAAAAALLTIVAAAACGDGPTPAGPTPPMEEARALWVNRFEIGPTPAKIAEIMRKAKDAGFNVVYFQVRGQGDAYYASDIEPCAVALCGSLGNGQPSWDPLATAVQEAHARGLQLHAWVNAFTAWASPATNTASFCALLRESAAGAPRHMLLAHPEWAMVSSGSPGTVMSCANSQAYEYAYVSPGVPAARTHLARVAADVARRYAVDGVHLDRIRYPGADFGWDQASLSAFGRDPSADPQGWARFRRELVNRVVQETHDSIHAVRAVPLSAAVWPIYDRDRFGWPSSSGVGQFFQDTWGWAQGGYLDVAVPMAYFRVAEERCSYRPLRRGQEPNPDWDCMIADHVAGMRPTGRHVYAGILAGLGRDEMAKQVRIGRQRGVDGFSFYFYSSLAELNAWAFLGDGVFAERATVPRMEWMR